MKNFLQVAVGRCALLGALVAGFAARANLADEWLQFFESRNTTANLLLAPLGTVRPDANLERPDAMTRMTCPVCDGKGAVNVQEPDYGQWEGRLNKGGKMERRTCPLCAGKKMWRAYIEPRELYAIIAQARNAFVAAHQAAGEIPAGLAFVTRELHDSVPRKQLKLVDDAYGKPCSRCEWSGIEECKKCKGAGTVKCTGKDCKDGWIVTRTVVETSPGRSYGHSRHHRRSTTRRETVSVSMCPVCQGAYLLVCPECDGRRAAPCSKCHGLGFKQKR